MTGPGRETNDGKWAETGGDGHVESVNGESVDRGMSSNVCWDSNDNARDDEGPSGDTNGDRR